MENDNEPSTTINLGSVWRLKNSDAVAMVKFVGINHIVFDEYPNLKTLDKSPVSQGREEISMLDAFRGAFDPTRLTYNYWGF